MFVPDIYVALFASDAALKEISIWALRIYMGAAFMMGIQIACQQTFVSIGQAKISLFLALLRKIFLLIPMIFLLPSFFADKVFAVLLAEPIADFIAASTTFILFKMKFEKFLNQTSLKATEE